MNQNLKVICTNILDFMNEHKLSIFTYISNNHDNSCLFNFVIKNKHFYIQIFDLSKKRTIKDYNFVYKDIECVNAQLTKITEKMNNNYTVGMKINLYVQTDSYIETIFKTYNQIKEDCLINNIYFVKDLSNITTKANSFVINELDINNNNLIPHKINMAIEWIV